jgi:hypothetical protein
MKQSEGRSSLELDVKSSESQINALIERRASQRDRANELAEMWGRSERAHREKIRREHRAAWYEFEMLLADNHAALSEEHRARAEALLEEPGGVG